MIKADIKIWNFKELVHEGVYQFDTESEARNYGLGLFSGLQLAGKKVTGVETKVTEEKEYEDKILMIPVSHVERKELENIEGEKFDSREEIEKLFCFDEDNPMATEDVNLFTLSEFMDACNNTDDDTIEDEKVDITEKWVGWVKIAK